jgi:hypothetical protein
VNAVHDMASQNANVVRVYPSVTAVEKCGDDHAAVGCGEINNALRAPHPTAGHRAGQGLTAPHRTTPGTQCGGAVGGSLGTHRATALELSTGLSTGGDRGVPGATVSDVATPEEIADALSTAGVDPELSVARMVGAARAAGVRAQTGALKAGAVEHKRRSGQSVDEVRPPRAVSRAEAASLLGLSVKRVDQLRAEGRLRGTRHPFTGHVWLELASVREERARRGMDRLVVPG